MKKCPQCTRVYDDDTMSFCLDDGSPLEKYVGKGVVSKIGQALTEADEKFFGPDSAIRKATSSYRERAKARAGKTSKKQ